MALIQNITSSVILKLTLKIQVSFWVSMHLQVMTKFEHSFGKLGKGWELTDELFSRLEEFICTLLGYKEKSADKFAG